MADAVRAVDEAVDVAEVAAEETRAVTRKRTKIKKKTRMIRTATATTRTATTMITTTLPPNLLQRVPARATTEDQEIAVERMATMNLEEVVVAVEAAVVEIETDVATIIKIREDKTREADRKSQKRKRRD